MPEDFSEYTSSLKLHERTRARLKNAGLGRIEQIESASDADLLLIRGIGPNRLKEIRAAIAQHRGQSEQGAIPETFYKADRDAAKAGLTPLQLAYVERLEQAVKAGDRYWTIMQTCVMSPRQYACSEAVLEANALVNFCSEQDSFPLAECHLKEADSDELPRDVIFS